MEKNKVLFTPMEFYAADEIIKRVYHGFFDLRQTKIMKGAGGNG